MLLSDSTHLMFFFSSKLIVSSRMARVCSRVDMPTSSFTRFCSSVMNEMTSQVLPLVFPISHIRKAFWQPHYGGKIVSLDLFVESFIWNLCLPVCMELWICIILDLWLIQYTLGVTVCTCNCVFKLKYQKPTDTKYSFRKHNFKWQQLKTN